MVDKEPRYPATDRFLNGPERLSFIDKVKGAFYFGCEVAVGSFDLVVDLAKEPARMRRMQKVLKNRAMLENLETTGISRDLDMSTLEFLLGVLPVVPDEKQLSLVPPQYLPKKLRKS